MFRRCSADVPPGPTVPKSTVLSVEDEAVIVAFRGHTLLALDDCLYALQPTIPHLTRSSLHRCLQRHGISRLPEVAGDVAGKKTFKACPIGFFHIDIAEVQTALPRCRRRKFEADQKTVRGTVFPTNGSISLLPLIAQANSSSSSFIAKLCAKPRVIFSDILPKPCLAKSTSC